MPAIIPLLAVYGGVTAGVAMAATGVATFAGALAVAGGMAAGMGLLTNDKKLQKFGSMLALAGGAVNMVSGLSTGAAQAGEASSAWNAADAAAGTDAAQFNKYAKPIAEAAGPAADVASGAQTFVNPLSPPSAGDYVSGMGTQPFEPAGALNSTNANSLTGSLTGAQPATIAMPELGGVNPGMTPGAGPPLSGVEGVAKGMNITQADIASYFKNALEKSGTMLNEAGQWVKTNPQLATIGGQMLSGMYGPQAEAMDYQRSIYDRARKNMNSPARIQFTNPVGG